MLLVLGLVVPRILAWFIKRWHFAENDSYYGTGSAMPNEDHFYHIGVALRTSEVGMLVALLGLALLVCGFVTREKKKQEVEQVPGGDSQMAAPQD